MKYIIRGNTPRLIRYKIETNTWNIVLSVFKATISAVTLTSPKNQPESLNVGFWTNTVLSFDFTALSARNYCLDTILKIKIKIVGGEEKAV